MLPKTEKLSVQSGGSRVKKTKSDMEVKGHLITGPDLQAALDSKQRAERMVALQERRRSLQAILSTRLAELKRLCLQEAELLGEIPNDYPLESGEKPPHVRRRAALTRNGSKHNSKSEEEDCSQRKMKKTLFSGALRRHTDSEQLPAHNKRTVHRGCHTENTVKSDGSSMCDSTNQDTEDISDGRSTSGSRLISESPDNRISRKLSPVEIYYEIKTRRNSVSSSASPSHSLPRSLSNLEGRSVPATPILSRNGTTGAHIRSESSSGISAVKQRADNPEASHQVPAQSQDVCEEQGGKRPTKPVRNGSYKSSELDSMLKPPQRSSTEHQINSARSGVGGRGITGGGGYNEILMDYVWGKQQQKQQRLQLQNGAKSRAWPENAPPPPYRNGFPQSQQLILANGPPAYSPLMLRGKPGDPRRVKVSRTKSCGPFVPLPQHQQESIVLSAYSETTTTIISTNGTAGNDQPHRAPHQSSESSTASTPDDPTRSLHKALALEGLRDWYLRNALGQTSNGGKGKDGTQIQRRRTTSSLQNSQQHPTLKHQPQSCSADSTYPQILPQSATFHGHPLHTRSIELALYQDSFSSKIQDMTLKENSNDRPTPGTLV